MIFRTKEHYEGVSVRFEFLGHSEAAEIDFPLPFPTF